MILDYGSYVIETYIYAVRTSTDRTSRVYCDVMRQPHIKFKGFTVCFMVRLHNALAFKRTRGLIQISNLMHIDRTSSYVHPLIVHDEPNSPYTLYFPYPLLFLHNYCDRMLYVTNLMILDYRSYVVHQLTVRS